MPAVGNATQNYPFSQGVSKEKYWILENFFSSGVTGKLLGLTVIYPDFTLETKYLGVVFRFFPRYFNIAIFRFMCLPLPNCWWTSRTTKQAERIHMLQCIFLSKNILCR